MKVILFPDGTYAAISPGVDPEIEANKLGGEVIESSNLPDSGFFPAVPQRITMRQAKLEMIEQGIYSQLLQYKSSLPEKDQLILEAELSGNFMERDSPVVLQIAQLLEISEEQLDELFINAEKR